MTFSNTIKFWFGAVTLTALAGCNSTDSSSSTSRTEVDVAVEAVIDETILPAVANFQAQAKTLDDQAEAFCASNGQNTSSLTALQGQWKATQNAWYELLPFNFGPLQVKDILVTPAFYYIDSFRVRGDNNSTSIRADIKTLISSTSDINDSLFAAKSFDDVGLLALEILTYETTDSTPSTAADDIVTEYSTEPKKCQILVGQSAELLRRATIFNDAWITDYRETGTSYKTLLLNNQLESILDDEDGKDAFTMMTVTAQELYDYFGKRDVSTNVGQLSNSAWKAISSAIESTEQLLEGTNQTSVSLMGLMVKKGNEQSVDTIRANIQTLKDSVTEKNDVDFKAAAIALDGNFKREIPDALDVSLGLNFTDGD